LRTAAVLNVRRGATTVSARKLTPPRAAVLKVERAKILAGVVLADGGGLEYADGSDDDRKLTPARAAVFMVERAKRDMLNFLMNPLNQKPGTPQFGYLE
jgi:hypothetical protein